MKIRDVMSRPVVVLLSYASIRDVARHMDYNGVGSVVLSDAQRLVGIVTDRDLALRALCARSEWRSPGPSGDDP
ncbi:signal-transduction protein with cAMP-binding, CBS, and nucleotidyltransferase domain [Nonomuraea muscovyensis]|uniref:Signal-transduction protein with cAMP-binding, CBS, and nucleotidyltransferase domain n=1 Tax=Nonomuraea muscovyensis TaxID=1124761 RepID=A0A7X0BZW0_9ACTN|nr:CBS domain-containing protein [Nonomuraea muscovyensis]MBB6345832.1 signal-transduction protein with cAMP-binding, CBS, and nucleotidyltransferase domain [Nonomuraea muscovyensis]